MKCTATPINGVYLAESNPVSDSRGGFMRLYCEKELSQFIQERRIVQINQSRTTKVGAVRGMHFQYPPHAEMKIIRCLKGRVWDVAVDLRKGSPTFLQWHAEELSHQNARMMIIPEGCAHGFQVLEPESELLYLHTAFYTPSSEGGLPYNDPSLAITWHLPVTDLSARDQQHPSISSQFSGISL
jgi:dTDP-4-dehydrorhamnose 3,5-epimerase